MAMKRMLLLSLLTALLGGCVVTPYGFRDRGDYYHRYGSRDDYRDDYRYRNDYRYRDGYRDRDHFYHGDGYFPSYSYRDHDHGS
jgi:hypothetical protein